MEEKKGQPTTVDEYIASSPAEVQEILNKIRAVIRETAPEAEEKISYAMPGYFLNGGLVWFSANKHHIGLYPRTTGMVGLVSTYKSTKGSVHFPLDQPIPYELIAEIVRVRVAENLKKG